MDLLVQHGNRSFMYKLTVTLREGSELVPRKAESAQEVENFWYLKLSLKTSKLH